MSARKRRPVRQPVAPAVATPVTKTGILTALLRWSGSVPESFKRKVRCSAGAPQAFEILVAKAGLKEELIWGCLWALSNLERISTLGKTRRTQGKWYALPGFPAYTLRRFPDRIDDMAVEIERLNSAIESDELFRAIRDRLPEIVQSTGSGSHGTDLLILSKLPDHMRLYASAVRAVDRLATAFALKGKTRLYKALDEFMQLLVRSGKDYAGEVATLLTAAYASLGSTKIVDPRALRMRRARFSHSHRKR